MSLKALVYAYVIGGITFIPLLIISLIAFTVYTSVPVQDSDTTKSVGEKPELSDTDLAEADEPTTADPSLDLNDLPKTRRGWLTMRRTFEEVAFDGSYVTLMKSFLDSRSKDPKRSRPRDMWYVVLKGKVLYLYEDEGMTECEAAIELGSHEVVIYPEGLPDGELFTKRNAICLRPKPEKVMPSVTRKMQLSSQNVDEKAEELGDSNQKEKQKEKERLLELERERDSAREEASDPSTPWFIFVRSSVEMEDWYLSLIHASDHPANSSTLSPLHSIYSPADMNHLVATLDEQPDVIPMRWLNALLGRIFFSYYNTDALESFIIERLMKKLAKVKRPNFFSEVVITQVDLGNRPIMFSKPMLKELTKEGDAALELHAQYKGEIRITTKAVATISLGFKPYTVKLILAVVLRELEGNLVVRVKRPPSNRIWYAFTHMPKMVLDVEPVVSDRQITWGMILHTIESRLREIILESIVLPNMDDIAFFDSSSYSHRGGIWPDAIRREKPNVSNVSSAGDDVSSVSAPPDVDISSSSGEPDPHSQVKRSSSDGEVGVDADPQNTSPQVPYRHTTTLPASRGSSPTPQASTRQSFNYDPGVEGPDTPTEAALLEDQPPVLRHKASSSSEKSKKTRFLGIRRTSRSPSPSPPSHPSSRDISPAPSLKNLRPPSLERPNGASTHTDISRTNSLLSTLKSRAGDRQTLSNTAKETMRKWTNWGGLKKDRNSNATSSEDVRDGQASKVQSASQKVKSSYAEIRAAVDERRDKERRNSDVSSSSINTPERGHKERAVSVSPMQSPQVSSFSSSQVTSSLAAGGPADPLVDETSLLEQLSARSPTVDVDGTQLGSEDLIDVGLTPVTLISPPVHVPPPIQSQPSQGKTMTIPSIHARNRGEVMSMGYVPPSPPAPEVKSGVSVLRLWKPSPATQTEHADRDGEHASSTSPLPLIPDSMETSAESVPQANSPRPQPPPLPPRTPASASASASLNPIVSRGGESRVESESTQDVEGVETSSFPVSPGHKPPLPPRKIHASA